MDALIYLIGCLFIIANPACDEVGCGEWSAPEIPNPEYRGKWKAPLIDNPNYMVSYMYIGWQ